MKKFNSPDKRMGVRSIFSSIVNMCRFEDRDCLVKDSQMVSPEFTSKFSFLSQKEWEEIYNISLAATFSDRVPEKEDIKEMKRLYKKLRKKMLLSYRGKRLKKIIFKYVFAY